MGSDMLQCDPIFFEGTGGDIRWEALARMETPLYSMRAICGQAIAVGRLVDCRPMTKDDEDDCFVKYRSPWKEKKEGRKGFA